MSRLSRSLPFAVAFIMPLLCAVAILSGGMALWIPPLFLFVATPILDALLGDRLESIEPESAASAWRDLRYDIWLYAWVPAQLLLEIAAIQRATHATPAEFVGLTFAAGMIGGLGIKVAHELMHRKGRPERALAEVLMTSVSYTHFCVEHVLGHHKDVATPSDPASARKGEWLQAFWLRSIVLGLRSAWRLETARVQKSGGGGTLRDRRIRYPAVWLVVLAAIWATAGARGVLAFFCISATAVLLLESINYLEHYGLQRSRDAHGAWGRVTPEHSWSSARRLTSLYLFNLTRHADHHAHASRPYFALRHLEVGPKLPWGYATMLIVAQIPPLWTRVMDPRVPPPANPAA